MGKKKSNEPKMLSKKAIKELGWTDKMIKELLPEPKEVTNPIFKSAKPMKLWKESTVLKVMKTDEYKKMKEKLDKRRKSAKKAVETKKNKLKKQVEKAIKEIRIKVLEEDELRKVTIKEKQKWYDYQMMMREGCCDILSAKYADEETMRRWMVNYIRHNLTEYDVELFRMSGKVGCREEYRRYKKAIMIKISKAYPYLKDECERQICA